MEVRKVRLNGAEENSLLDSFKLCEDKHGLTASDKETLSPAVNSPTVRALDGISPVIVT
jgi:hypothetical protein